MQLQSQEFYIYGAGLFGKALADICLLQGILPKAFLDRAPKAASYRGIPIQLFAAEVADFKLPVLVTVLGYPGTEELIRKKGFTQVLDAEQVMTLYPDAVAALNQCGFLWMQSPATLQYDPIACPQFFRLLSDEHSRRTFTQICNFRQFPCAAHYPQPEHYEMYFPTDIPGLYDYQSIRLLDVGAFDGDSLKGFYQRWPEKLFAYTGIEISADNIRAFWQRVDNLAISREKLTLIRGAVGVPAGQQLVTEENKSATRIRFLEPGEQVRAEQLVDTLDLGEIATEMACNVLKMDIEGADFAALQQALCYISTATPTLALSVYHRPQDLWQMALVVEQLAPGKYRWYIRQEGHWGLETICYAVPVA